jgi:hypothetical protein
MPLRYVPLSQMRSPLMKIRSTFLVLAALVLAGSVPAHAQTSALHLGPRLSYNVDAEMLGVGAQLGVPVARQLEFYPSFDIFFPDQGSSWALNMDLKYRVSSELRNWLYVGGGLNLSGNKPDRGESNTRARANLLAGVESLRGNVHPFAELRAILGSGSTMQLSAGLNFTLGH